MQLYRPTRIWKIGFKHFKSSEGKIARIYKNMILCHKELILRSYSQPISS